MKTLPPAEPARYRPDLAWAYSSQGHILSANDMGEDARISFEKGVVAIKANAADNPAAFSPLLRVLLEGFVGSLRSTDTPDEEIFRRLEAFDFDMSLLSGGAVRTGAARGRLTAFPPHPQPTRNWSTHLMPNSKTYGSPRSAMRSSRYMINLAKTGPSAHYQSSPRLCASSSAKGADVAPIASHDCSGPIVLWAGLQLALHSPAGLFQKVVRANIATWYRGELVDVLPEVKGGRTGDTRLQPALYAVTLAVIDLVDAEKEGHIRREGYGEYDLYP